MPTSLMVYDEQGVGVPLGSEIGRGGEGTIFALAQNQLDCAKAYNKPLTQEDLRKLELMVEYPPDDPTWGTRKHRSISWPTSLLYRDLGCRECVGFVMPKINTQTFRKALCYFDTADRIKLFGGAFNWKYLYATVFNIVSAVAAVHARGHCIGDLNESNVLVARNSLITLIDCDSFQVQDPSSGKVFRCPVGKPEYAAPELHGKPYRDVDRTPETDCFALGVLIFQFLMGGTHPYQAKGKLVDDAPTTQQKILRGHFSYTMQHGEIAPPDYALPFGLLAGEIQQLFHRCFADGHKNPHARPTAREWFEVLRAFFGRFTLCATNPNHFFLDHLSYCPWCEIKLKKGKELFPSPLGQQIALDDPSMSLEGLEKRLDYLRTYVVMALSDAILTPEEESHLTAIGSKLAIPPKEVEKLIQEEVKAKAKTGSSARGVPKLEISQTRFEFQNLRAGEVRANSFVVNNVGGGVLQGSVASNVPWLRPLRAQIDPARHRQEVDFEVDTAGLSHGLKQTGILGIRTNGGTERVLVDLSVEVPEVALGRFRSRLTWAGLGIGGLLGYLVYSLMPAVGIRQATTGLAKLTALIAVTAAGARLSGVRGGIGGLAGAIFVAIILEQGFPHAESTAAWAFVFGMLLNFFSRPLFLLRERDTRLFLTIAIASGVVITAAFVIAGVAIGPTVRTSPVPARSPRASLRAPARSSLPLLQIFVTTCASASGRGEFVPKNQFLPGEQVCIYSEAINVGNGREVNLDYEFLAFAPDNSQLFAQPRQHPQGSGDPSFAAWECFTLAESVTPGTFRAQVSIRDNQKGEQATQSVTFGVVSHQIPALAGRWSGEFVAASRRVPFEVEIQQDGTRFLGAVSEKSPLDELLYSDITGEIEGTNIRFSKLYRTSSKEVTYTGQVAPDGLSAKGIWQIHGRGSGEWRMQKSPGRPASATEDVNTM